MSGKDGERRTRPAARVNLDRYQERKQLIESYKAEMAEGLMTTDTVVGSMAEFPYTEQVVVLHGIDEKRAQVLQERICTLEEQCIRAEAFIAGVSDEHMRSLLYWHYIKGQSWSKVRKTLRMRDVTSDCLRKCVIRFLQKKT